LRSWRSSTGSISPGADGHRGSPPLFGREDELDDGAGPRPLRSRGQVAHAATRGRSEARWHGAMAPRPDIARVAATSPTWPYRPIRAGCRPAPMAPRPCIGPHRPCRAVRAGPRRSGGRSRSQLAAWSKARRCAPVAQQPASGLFDPVPAAPPKLASWPRRPAARYRALSSAPAWLAVRRPAFSRPALASVG
jgi:hypothetical protein